MSDEHDKLFTARPPPNAEGADVYSASTVAGDAPEGLLDLVRSAEESAKVSLDQTPGSANKFRAAPAEAEDNVDDEMETPRMPEVVDVTAEADDVLPSEETTPMLGVSTSERPRIAPSALPPSVTRQTATTASREETTPRAGLPPAVGVAILLALAVAALALLAR